VLKEEKEEEEGEDPHEHEDSCGVAYNVIEYDQKLNTSTLEEEDQRCVQIIGGINIFLPSNPTEASVGVAEERKPLETVMEKEK